MAIVGHVGCGKTTLLSALLGETEKLSGKVYVKVSICNLGFFYLFVFFKFVLFCLLLICLGLFVCLYFFGCRCRCCWFRVCCVLFQLGALILFQHSGRMREKPPFFSCKNRWAVVKQIRVLKRDVSRKKKSNQRCACQVWEMWLKSWTRSEGKEQPALCVLSMRAHWLIAKLPVHYDNTRINKSLMLCLFVFRALWHMFPSRPGYKMQHWGTISFLDEVLILNAIARPSALVLWGPTWIFYPGETWQRLGKRYIACLQQSFMFCSCADCFAQLYGIKWRGPRGLMD